MGYLIDSSENRVINRCSMVTVWEFDDEIDCNDIK